MSESILLLHRRIFFHILYWPAWFSYSVSDLEPGLANILILVSNKLIVGLMAGYQ
jgi:hypothetical protein